MATDVKLPQLGESIAEGTIVKWLKKVGDKVERDEPILEISTDKVDAEVPAPVAGIIVEILAKEGETVAVNSIIARLNDNGSGVAPAAPQVTAAPAAPSPAPAAPVAPSSTPAAPAAHTTTSTSKATDVKLPQLGESIAEGTIVKWLKKVGDKVERDEPILEISTDKVDAEVPAPAAGIIVEILAKEGETVAVNSIIARLNDSGSVAAPAAAAAPQVDAAPVATPVTAPATQTSISGNGGGDKDRVKSSPLVRNIAREHGVDLAQVPGTGTSGRITKDDILSFIETDKSGAPTVAPTPSVAAPVQASTAPTAPVVPAYTNGERVTIEPLSVMRRKIAEHMVMSKRTSPHVTTFFEIDFTRISKLRDKFKKSYEERHGAKLTFMPFIIKAVIDALRAFPTVNASLDGNNVVYKHDINIGVAVALDWGLIVPVIKHADSLSLAGLAKSTQDLASRARNKQLKPDEVSGGTFSITNFGLYGGVTATPVINQPQVAILGIGGIHKRPWIVETPAGDAITIRQIGVLCLSFDHRLIDGAVAEQFMAHIKKNLETTDFSSLV